MSAILLDVRFILCLTGGLSVSAVTSETEDPATLLSILIFGVFSIKMQ